MAPGWTTVPRRDAAPSQLRPGKVIARSDKQLLEPETEDEISGIVPNVVFRTFCNRNFMQPQHRRG
jgi:hypothetical protein